ncbi:THAP-type domain-containing protein [Aphis craccivora]|uniref:THAP-type domain-containing protein n=1 Tax=Aphis craccivora TaxID=307492 RepID=A0A6G0YCZ8_APHCR|nr:THAP-type domain-containing protein [Aphis craccivora]
MCNSLYAINKDDFLNSFITLNNKDCNEGGLTYPSDDSYDCENKRVLTNLTHFIHNTSIFNSLKNHTSQSNNPLSDHIILLI